MKYCIRCMEPLTDEKCPSCGSLQDYTAPAHHLLPGTVLSGKYCIGAAIGEGGFGITYIGRDTRLEMRVAVKEYYPNGYVNRSATVSANVQPAVSEERLAFYRKGKERFLQEARTLAQFSGEPGIVDVRDFFEENETVYIVMAYLDGETLRDHLKRNGKMKTEDAVTLLLPVMHSLEHIHQKGLVHRDISPDNIMLVDGGAQLIDFGAARNVMGEGGKSLSVVVKPGYAPEEQYRTKGEQGPWTDVYALCATLYRCITGRVPDDAADRLREDTLKRPSELGIEISPAFEEALMMGMAVYAEDRFQSIQALLEALNGNMPDAERTQFRPDLDAERTTYRTPMPVPAVQLQKPEQPVYAPPQSTPPVYTPPQQPAPPVYDQPQQAPAVEIKPVKKKKGKALPFIIGGVAVVAAIAAIAGVVALSTKKGAIRIGERTFKSDETSLYLYHMELTPSDLENIGRLTKLDSLTIHECIFTSGAERKLSALPSSIRYLYLTGLNLTNQELKSVNPSKMKELRTIDLSNNSQLTDLSALTPTFGTLTTLRINGTGIKDLSSLQNAAKLSNLEVSRCPSADFSTLHVASLYTFSAENNDLTDISFLAEHGRLGTVDLSNNQISDLTPLAGLQNISRLYLGNNKVENIAPLAGMNKLDKLELQQNSIKTLSPLNDVKQLSYLDVCRNELTDLKGLETAIKLDKLFASENKLTSLDGIENCTILQTVNLRDNKLTDLGTLGKNAETLKVVQVSGNALTGLDALKDCTSLNALIVDNNKLTSLESLLGCTDLQVISAEHNELTSLKGLEKVKSLQALYVPDNKITDISALQELNALSSTDVKVLNLAGNQVKDLQLNSMIKYHALIVYNNPLSDAEAVRRLTGDKLYLSYYDGIQIAGLTDGFSHCSLVDVPLDMQVSLKEDSGRSYHIAYATAEEADEEIGSTKKQLMNMIDGEPDELSEQE
ncbi:MAG: leucine-rich repeat domain-containing protein [Oscillospiraceae bacterium]|nr:leucine-rich repeat domain-containing protein [Oscillospiraceae bacterium]